MSAPTQLITSERLRLACGLVSLILWLPVRPIFPQSGQTGSLDASFDPGVMVEDVSSNTTTSKLGLKRGDVLLLWRCVGSRLELKSPFDFSRVERHRVACSGPSQFEGLRGTEHHTWDLGPEYWGITVQPNFKARLRSKYDEGVSFFAKHMFSAALDSWHELVSQSAPSWLQPWLALRAADLFAEARLWPEADTNYQRAAELAPETEPLVLADILYAWGEAFWRRSEWEHAEQRYRLALAEAERDGDIVYIAKMLNGLGSASLNGSSEEIVGGIGFGQLAK